MFNDTDVLKIRMRDWGVRGQREGDRKEDRQENNEEGLLNALDQILQASSRHTGQQSC